MEVIRVKRAKSIDLSNHEIDEIADICPKRPIYKFDLSYNYITSIGKLSNIRMINLDHNCIHDLTPLFNIPELIGLSLYDAIGYPDRISEYNVEELKEPILGKIDRPCNLEVLTLGNITKKILQMIFPRDRRIIGDRMKELTIYGKHSLTSIPMRIRNSDCEINLLE